MTVLPIAEQSENQTKGNVQNKDFSPFSYCVCVCINILIYIFNIYLF